MVGRNELLNTHPSRAMPSDSLAGDSPFLFIGDTLALDLVNTEQIVRGQRRDLLATPDSLALWWQAAQHHHPSVAEVQDAGVAITVDAAALSAAKSLRAALRGIFGAIVDAASINPSQITILNAVLRTGARALALISGGDVTPVYQILPGEAPMLFAVALSAVELLRGGDRQRLHRCGNDRCVLLFYDTTKSATRRWCSVGCMDRARSFRRYQAAKQHGHPAEADSPSE